MPLTRPKKVPTGNLSGTVLAAMPAGTILQRVYEQPTTNGNTISTTSYTAIGMDLSITPKRSGLYIQVNVFQQ